MSDKTLRPVGLLYCDFCGRTADYVVTLIAGPRGHHICDQCVRECSDIIAQAAKVKADAVAQTNSKAAAD